MLLNQNPNPLKKKTLIIRVKVNAVQDFFKPLQHLVSKQLGINGSMLNLTHGV